PVVYATQASLLDRITVKASGLSAVGVQLGSGATMRDSTVLSTGDDGAGVSVYGDTARLRNDTIVAAGSNSQGVRVYGGATGEFCDFPVDSVLHLENDIVRGTKADVLASSGCNASAHVTVNRRSSNVRPDAIVLSGANVTAPDLGGNQSGNPGLADPLSGD